MFGKGTNAADDIGYLFGGLGNLSDIVNLKSTINANNRTNAVDQVQLTAYEGQPDGLINHGNYLGPSGTNSPLDRCNYGTEPVDAIDEYSFTHDVGYYKNGADGVPDALFNTKVLDVDKGLVAGARNILNNPSGYSDACVSWASKVNYTFSGIVGFKTMIQNSYLYQSRIYNNR